jgi:hypothetical protein
MFSTGTKEIRAAFEGVPFDLRPFTGVVTLANDVDKDQITFSNAADGTHVYEVHGKRYSSYKDAFLTCCELVQLVGNHFTVQYPSSGGGTVRIEEFKKIPGELLDRDKHGKNIIGQVSQITLLKDVTDFPSKNFAGSDYDIANLYWKAINFLGQTIADGPENGATLVNLLSWLLLMNIRFSGMKDDQGKPAFSLVIVNINKKISEDLASKETSIPWNHLMIRIEFEKLNEVSKAYLKALKIRADKGDISINLGRLSMFLGNKSGEEIYNDLKSNKKIIESIVTDDDSGCFCNSNESLHDDVRKILARQRDSEIPTSLKDNPPWILIQTNRDENYARFARNSKIPSPTIASYLFDQSSLFFDDSDHRDFLGEADLCLFYRGDSYKIEGQKILVDLLNGMAENQNASTLLTLLLHIDFSPHRFGETLEIICRRPHQKLAFRLSPTVYNVPPMAEKEPAKQNRKMILSFETRYLMGLLTVINKAGDPYATAFIAEFRGELYGVTCGHILKDDGREGAKTGEFITIQSFEDTRGKRMEGEILIYDKPDDPKKDENWTYPEEVMIFKIPDDLKKTLNDKSYIPLKFSTKSPIELREDSTNLSLVGVRFSTKSLSSQLRDLNIKGSEVKRICKMNSSQLDELRSKLDETDFRAAIEGMSGSPIWDESTGCICGMQIGYDELFYESIMITAEGIQEKLSEGLKKER